MKEANKYFAPTKSFVPKGVKKLDQKFFQGRVEDFVVNEKGRMACNGPQILPNTSSFAIDTQEIERLIRVDVGNDGSCASVVLDGAEDVGECSILTQTCRR